MHNVHNKQQHLKRISLQHFHCPTHELSNPLFVSIGIVLHVNLHAFRGHAQCIKRERAEDDATDASMLAGLSVFGSESIDTTLTKTLST